MANEFNKIFGDAEPSKNTELSEDTEALNSADDVTEENSIPSSEPKVSARENYMRDIFGDDVDKPSEFEENFDENAVFIKDKDGNFVKKNDEEETLKESEEQEDLLDEADELFENPRKKKVKKPVKKPEHKPEAVNTAIKRDIFETEAEEEIISPSANGVSDNEISADNTPTSPQIDDLDKGDNFIEEPKKEPKRADSDDTAKNYEHNSSIDDEFSEIEKLNFEADERSTTVSRNRNGEKSISEMSREEIEQLTPEEISKLSPHEKRELLKKVDEYNASEIQDDDVIEIDSAPTPFTVNKDADNTVDAHTTGAEKADSSVPTNVNESAANNDITEKNNDITSSVAHEITDNADNYNVEKDNTSISTSVEEDVDKSDYVYTPKAEEHNVQTDKTPIPSAVREDANASASVNTSISTDIDESVDNFVYTHESSVYDTHSSSASNNTDSTVGVRAPEKEYYTVPPIAYESADSATHRRVQSKESRDTEKTETPTSTATYESVNGSVYAHTSKEEYRSAEESDYTPMPSVENDVHSDYIPSSVNDIVHNTTEHSSKETPSPAVVYYGNRVEVYKPRQEFNAESFRQDLQHYTGYDINVVDKGDNFEVYTPNQIFTLNKTSGDVVGEAGTLSTIIGKTYEQYSPAPITSPQSSAIKETVSLKPPERVDTWSPEKVISGFDGKYGEITVSANENGHTVLIFPEQRGASSFSVELNNTHQPISINNPPPFVKDVVDSIYQQNQNIAATDNAEYIRQKTIYNDAVRAQQGEVRRSFPVSVYTSVGFNPNGTSTKIGDGYNLANNPQSPTGSRTYVFTNPYLSDKIHPSVVAGYRAAFANLDKSTFVGYEPVNSYVQNIYQDFVNFRENLNNDESYVDTTYSDAKTTVYNEEKSKSAPFSFSEFSGTSNETAYSPVPFNYNNAEQGHSAQAVFNVQTYGSAINPVYNIQGFSQYRFLQESKQFAGRATQSISRPLLNTIKATASSTEVGQGARQITGYFGAPVLIGAYAAYKNIWRKTNTREMLSRTSERTRYIVTNRLNNAGVFFKRSHILDSFEGIRKAQKGIARRGKEIGLNNIGGMKYADLQALKNALRHKTIMYQGKKIDLASAKSIFRHFGDKAPEDIKLWIEQYRLADAAIAFKGYLDAVSDKFIDELKSLSIVRTNETFDLMNLRDIQILQRRLSKYAENKGYGELSEMATKKLLEWIQKYQGEESAAIAEKLVFLKKYQKRAKRMGNMKFARFFAILQLIQTVMKNNDVVSGGLMMYRTVHSAIMATKATIRLIKTSTRFLGFVGRKLGRFAIRTHLDVPVKAVGKVLRVTGRTIGKATRQTRAGARVARSVHSIKSSTLAQRAVSTHKKFKAGSSLKKTKFKKFVVGKPKIITKVTSKITNSAAWKTLSAAFTKTSAALGDIFLGAVIGVAILFGVTAVISLTGQFALLLYDKVTAFTEDFKETFNVESDLQKLYSDLEAQDSQFMEDMKKSGEESWGGEVNGYYDLSKFKNGTFPVYSIPKPGDKSAPEGSLNKIGYEYHLYDRMIPYGKTPASVNAKEIPFESNAKEIISCGNIIFYSDLPKNDIVFSDGSAKSYKEALKDYALKGSKFEDKNLWTATHSFFTLPSEKYSCATGCDTFKYNCGKYTAKTNGSNNYHSVTATPNDKSNAFYSLWHANSKSLKLYGAPMPQQTYGCQKHDKSNFSDWGAIDYEYYCGYSHLSNDGNCYVCKKENSSHKNIGHVQTVRKIKSCNEQQFVYTKQEMTFTHQTKDKKIASFCDFASAHNKIKNNMPKELKNNGVHPDNIYPFSTQINDWRGNAISGLKLNGWVFVTGEKNGKDVQAVTSYLKKNVCKNCKSSFQTEKIWLSAFDYFEVYCYIFYCGGETNCSHNISLYKTKSFDYTFTITDSSSTKYKIEYKNISLSYQCDQLTTQNLKRSISIPHFECVGYCDGKHEINYCKGHYNNVVTGYIVKSMDNTFDITCKNPECTLYNKPQKGVTDNVCSGFLKGKHDKCKQICLITNMNQNSIFYADSVYGPTSVGNMPAWGRFCNASDHFNFSTLGWYDNFKGASRMSSAQTKRNGDWNNLYGVSSVSEINSSRLDASEAEKLLELSQYSSISNGKERKSFVSLALRSSGQIPYYEGRSAISMGYDGNNFGGAAAKGDVRGRTLVGLDNKSWIVWAYASAKGDMTYLTRSINTGGYTAFDKKKYEVAKAGDIIVFDDGTYGIFVGMSDKKLCVVQEVGEPQNNVTVKYYSSAEGYIPYESALK